MIAGYLNVLFSFPIKLNKEIEESNERTLLFIKKASFDHN